jgi:hypothetical protein
MKYKIAICVRNRLAITKKCLEAIYKHSKHNYEIYIYDNLTNYRLTDHVLYFNKLFQRDLIQQYTVNSDKSTFNAFSKVVALNQFGHHHLMDPRKDKFFFLVFLDNDMIVAPDWDEYLFQACEHLYNTKNQNIKIVTQYPGGIKNAVNYPVKINNCNAFTGKYGGSGFWAVDRDFFTKVGFLDCKNFLFKNKKHDQLYWHKLNRAARNQNYTLAIQAKMALHTGGIAGSVCNQLTRNKSTDKLEKIKFKEADLKIDSLSFDDFYKGIKNKNSLYKW